MRKILFLFVACFALGTGMAGQAGHDGALPEVYVEGGKHHVQGIAYDPGAGRMYFSFTDRFLVTDMKGDILGSVEHIQGHLGAMVFDPSRRKVFASLECKDDVIGQGLSDFARGRSMFYIVLSMLIELLRLARILRIMKLSRLSVSGRPPGLSPQGFRLLR